MAPQQRNNDAQTRANVANGGQIGGMSQERLNEIVSDKTLIV